MLSNFLSAIGYSISAKFQPATGLTAGLLVLLFSIPAWGASELHTTVANTSGKEIALHELEPKITNAPEVLLSVAELEESISRLNRIEAEAGLKAFAGSDVGRFRESLGNEDFREYNQLNLKAGLRYPLFGSHIAEQKQIVQSEYDIQEKEKEQAVLHLNNLLLLRKSYIAYWSAQEKRLLTSTFLADEQMLTEALAHRKEAGLLLEADRLEFMSALGLVRRIDHQQQAEQQRALGFLNHITGQSIERFKAVFPQMEPPCTDAETLVDIIGSEHPRMAVIKEKIERQQELIHLTDQLSIEGHLDLVGQLSTEIPDAAPGYGIYLNVQFDFPWKAKQAISAQRQMVRNVRDQLKQRAVITESSLVMEARDALQTYQTAISNIDFSRQRLIAAQERVREDLLRLAYLPGDVIEKVQQSRIEALKAALDLIDGQAQKLTQQAVLLSFTQAKTPMEYSRGEDPEAVRYISEPAWEAAVKAIAGPDMLHGLTFYVWDTQVLPSASNSREKWFHDIAQMGVKRLMVSFTPLQITALQNQAEQRRDMAGLIIQAMACDIRVEWLLAEPSWILPEHRDNLTELIKAFEDIPFQGIHLDIEPDQLSVMGQDPIWVLNRLCETVADVKNATLLPVGLSMHYRYFQNRTSGSILASAFEEMALNEIVLMIYIADPKRVAAIAGPIFEQYPKLTFSIAQSVEPMLSPTESYFELTREDFLLKLTELSGQLNHHNFSSLVVQDWRSFIDLVQD